MVRRDFRVGLTRDFLGPGGTPALGDIGLDLLDAAGVTWEYLAEDATELQPEQARHYDALLMLAPRITATTVESCGRLAIVARFGVGYDSVDVAACTRNGVLVTITPDAVRRPVATATLTFLLALSHRLLIKDRLTRAGRWSEKVSHMGQGLTGRTLGVIGLGNIGREVFRLAKPLEMRHIGHDPFIDPGSVALDGIELMSLEELLSSADFVCVCCSLTAETHHLINAERLALMKPTASLINVARGPIVDQQALTEALQTGGIAGAALDVFEREPIAADDPLLALDNVIVTPHAVSWTDECFRDIGRSACRSILDVAAGNVPRHVVNRDVLTSPALQAKLQRHQTSV